ncbi:MAG: hypothetical protein IOC90_05980 [Methylocystis sp.]|nr:hypothetical protein [Methylocystis sp.]MCA3583228.1 hypothetical protein [Methylocystis sp.]MCA3587567.1 hypothetical protein [Methylocystis sp.]MCA3590694.1 hypothetical protein [Methylocystis sp.]
MRLFGDTLEIGEEDGFDGTDLFNRSRLGQGLTALVSAIEDPLVIALDGRWGTGKTVFLKQWAGTLRRANIPVVYFDAFAHDYQDDPFLALASEVVALAMRSEADKRTIDVIVDASKNVAIGGLKIGLRAGAASLTMGLSELVGPALTDVVKGASAKAVDAAEAVIERRLRAAEEERSTLDAFRKALADLPDTLGGEDKDRPLVIIVDELDRCRPLFAMQLLERMRHVFNAKRVHFVLGVNLAELAHVVRAVYGNGMNGEAYLLKFIHLIAELGVGSGTQPHTNMHAFVMNRWSAIAYKGLEARLYTDAAEGIAWFSSRLNLGLRDADRAVTNLALAAAVGQPMPEGFHPLLAGLSVMKVIDRTAYRRAARSELLLEEGLSLLNLVDEQKEDRKWRLYARIWRWALGEANADINGSLLRWGPPEDQREWLPVIIQSLFESFNIPEAISIKSTVP